MNGACGTCGAEVDIKVSTDNDGVTWTDYSCDECGTRYVLADAGMLDLEPKRCVPVSCEPVESHVFLPEGIPIFVETFPAQYVSPWERT